MDSPLPQAPHLLSPEPQLAESRASEAQSSAEPAALWDMEALAGRLVEISGPSPGRQPSSAATAIWDITAPRDAGSAALTCATSLLWKAQQRGEPAAWISARASTFFPPDLDDSGVDLAALVVVRLGNAGAAARAADKLLRSGAFGLVILDLGRGAVPVPLLSRLLGLAQKHQAAVLFVTEKNEDAPSLAPLVSLRVVASRRRIGSDRFVCTTLASKDKRRAPGWSNEETLRGPPGLR